MVFPYGFKSRFSHQQPLISVAVLLFIIPFADMAELVDALVSGSSERSCRFKSCYPHQTESSVNFGTALCFLTIVYRFGKIFNGKVHKYLIY